MPHARLLTQWVHGCCRISHQFPSNHTNTHTMTISPKCTPTIIVHITMPMILTNLSLVNSTASCTSHVK